jgi:hypothetical protein
MSFLAYIIRVYGPQLKVYEHIIAQSVLNLLIDCPADAAATRKVRL